MLVEDNSQNRVIEALNVFQYVVCHPAFRSRDVILFFNKNDILLEKIAEGKKVTDYLPNVKFEGDPLNVKDVQVSAQFFDSLKWLLCLRRQTFFCNKDFFFF